MTNEELADFVENLFLENCVAKNHLNTKGGVANPEILLRGLVEEMPQEHFLRQYFRPLRQQISTNSADPEWLQEFRKALAEIANRPD
jgi:hypothetical protein